MSLLDKVKQKITPEYTEIKKCVLAFSGGLDTTVIASLLHEMGIEVVTMTLEMGQHEDLKAIEQKAKEFLKIKKHYAIDVTKEFATDYISKAIKGNCLYEGTYPNATALGRPLIVKYLVEIAKKENAQAVAHGSTGKGNDQIRIDNGVKALSNLHVIVPVREWGLFRDEEIDYASEKGLPIPITKKKPYSIDQNLWGRSIECGPIEYPDQEVPEDAYEWTVNPTKAPDKPTYAELEFENGIPITMKVMDENKKEIDNAKGIDIIKKLNEIAGKNGVGRIEHMEDRVIGFKTREVYESPAAIAILNAHKDLEKYVLSKDELSFKAYVDNLWADLVYTGKWYSPLKRQLDIFMDETQKVVTGKVLVKLYKGSASVVARDSKNALYNINVATYDKGSVFNQEEGRAFTKLYGLQYTTAYKIRYGESD
ncbi:argininosuccinate synthase [Candidatus Micrarchaeota archaeon]|nr:argininosuccinate synthase [Candidatus Micrarchaeota archaeon]